MTDAPLTRERILAAAEDVVRRFGPQKATVVDVARALGVSHGSVYRHFPSKAALRDAVTEKWLARISAPLAAIAAAHAPAGLRLHRWLEALINAKRKKVLDDPELFAAYHGMARESREVVLAHVDHLVTQIAGILSDGVARGDLVTADPQATARAILDATSRFHHPIHAAEWSDPTLDRAFESVFALIQRGLGIVPVEAPPPQRATRRRQK